LLNETSARAAERFLPVNASALNESLEKLAATNRLQYAIQIIALNVHYTPAFSVFLQKTVQNGVFSAAKMG
jgi:hypothetical protein